jgi:hypothetical protein
MNSFAPKKRSKAIKLFTTTAMLCAAAASLSLGAWQMATADNGEVLLKSRIYHRSEDDFQKDACAWKGAQLGSAIDGKRLLDVFPGKDIKAVEMQGDEVTMPSSAILHVLTEGRFEKIKHPIAVGNAPAGRLRLKDGNCFQFNILIDPADGCISSVQTPMGTLSVPDFPACKQLIPKLKAGSTRAEVEKTLQPDGGLSVPFKYERYIVQSPKCTEKGEVLKLNFAFKPAGMSDVVYYLGKWVVPHQSPKDILMRISPPYVEMPYND